MTRLPHSNGWHRATLRRGGSIALLSWSGGCRRTWSAAAWQLWHCGLAGVASSIWQGLAKSSDTGWSGHAFYAAMITGSSIQNGTQDYTRGATTTESLPLLCAPHATSRRCNAWRRAPADCCISSLRTSTCTTDISGAEECWTPFATQAETTAAQAHDLLPDFY